MKRLFAAVLIMVSALAIYCPAIVNAEGPIVILNEQRLSFDVDPVIIEGRTLVPLGAIFRALDANVEWNADTRTVYAHNDGFSLTITLDSDTAYINGDAVVLDVPATVVEGRTMIPLRVIAQTFGCYVSYDPDTNIVTIKTGPGFIDRTVLYQVPDATRSDQSIPEELSVGGMLIKTSDLSAHPWILGELSDFTYNGFGGRFIGWLNLKSGGEVSYTVPVTNWGTDSTANFITRWGYDGVSIVLYKEDGSIYCRLGSLTAYESGEPDEFYGQDNAGNRFTLRDAPI